MKANFYTIKCITNMHMGSGDINFNIVDNEVQRDPITGCPTMFSSGVKGAFREHMKNSEDVIKIFGNYDMENKVTTPGKLKFLSGYLVGLPVRASKGKHAYYMVTSKEMLVCFDSLYAAIMGKNYFGDLLDKIEENTSYRYEDDDEHAEVDGLKEELSKMGEMGRTVKMEISKFFGGKANVLILKQESLRKINLPVLARNQLEDGISQNLWYEEVVPHEAVFVTAVLSNGTKEGDDALDKFAKYIEKNSFVQFGGNATIGYGLTKVQLLSGDTQMLSREV